MSAPCAKCGRVHPTDAVIALGRFNNTGAVGWYAVNAPFSARRPTRDEAMADWCRMMAAQR
jgi:hypothetical protein